MTPEQINLKLAEWAGWKWRGRRDGWVSPDGEDDQWPPEYCSDLNAVRELVNRLDSTGRTRWVGHMHEITKKLWPNEWLPSRFIRADAGVWCEALLRTLELWEDA